MLLCHKLSHDCHILKLLYLFNYDTVSSNGTITHIKITAFLKKQPNLITNYKSIETGNKTLILTGNHLIFARKGFADFFNPM